MSNKKTNTSSFSISSRQQIMVFGMLVIAVAGLFGIFGLVGNFLGKPPIASYSQCIQATGSKLLESYPEICVSKDGKRFQNPSQLVTKPADS